MQTTGIAAIAITTFALAGAAAAQTVDLVEKQGVMEPLRRHGDAQGGVLHRRPAAGGRAARR